MIVFCFTKPKIYVTVYDIYLEFDMIYFFRIAHISEGQTSGYIWFQLIYLQTNKQWKTKQRIFTTTNLLVPPCFRKIFNFTKNTVTV